MCFAPNVDCMVKIARIIRSEAMYTLDFVTRPFAGSSFSGSIRHLLPGYVLYSSSLLVGYEPVPAGTGNGRLSVFDGRIPVLSNVLPSRTSCTLVYRYVIPKLQPQ
jgi:hypothetical protein